MRLAVIKEGKALIWIDDPQKAIVGGKFEPTRLNVFYNPLMEFNRDLSVIALQAYINLFAPHKPVKILEPLSATGVRGLRYALELSGVDEVILNDIDLFSWKILKMNVKLNSLEDKVRVYRKDASSLMYMLQREDPTPISIIDLDPYGSPAPFLNAALSLIGHRGLLAVTATDLAVLSGSKKQKLLKRYWIKSSDLPQKRELAVRALLSYIARVASIYDKAIKPLLSYYSDHYVRVYVLVERSASEAYKVLEENLGYAIYCESTGYSFLSHQEEVCSITGDKGKTMGPIWIGNLYDKSFIEEILSLFNTKFGYVATARRIEKLLNFIKKEIIVQREIYQHIPSIASKISKGLPRYDKLIECLEQLGFYSTRTHFDPLGIKTSAKYNDILQCIIRLARI
jgi:tRNA (guanine26-N2/guanine27-N2)-dimethyltransferase